MKKPLHRRIMNRLLGRMASNLPGATSLRPILHRLRGVRITGKVFIGDEVYVENEYPECIELHEGAQICLRSVLIAHTRGPGQIVIEKDVFVGAGCILIASPGQTLTIGEGAVIMAATVVSSSVAAHTLFGSEKGKPLARATVPLAMETLYTEFLAGIQPMKRPTSKAEKRR